MSHGHKHEDRKQEPPHAEPAHHHPSRKKWHRDWRVVCVAILMLLAMLIYVLTLDDSFLPGFRPAKRNQPAQTNPIALP